MVSAILFERLLCQRVASWKSRLSKEDTPLQPRLGRQPSFRTRASPPGLDGDQVSRIPDTLRDVPRRAALLLSLVIERKTPCSVRQWPHRGVSARYRLAQNHGPLLYVSNVRCLAQEQAFAGGIRATIFARRHCTVAFLARIDRGLFLCKPNRNFTHGRAVASETTWKFPHQSVYAVLVSRSFRLSY